MSVLENKMFATKSTMEIAVQNDALFVFFFCTLYSTIVVTCAKNSTALEEARFCVSTRINLMIDIYFSGFGVFTCSKVR